MAGVRASWLLGEGGILPKRKPERIRRKARVGRSLNRTLVTWTAPSTLGSKRLRQMPRPPPDPEPEPESIVIADLRAQMLASEERTARIRREIARLLGLEPRSAENAKPVDESPDPDERRPSL